MADNATTMSSSLPSASSRHARSEASLTSTSAVSRSSAFAANVSRVMSASSFDSIRRTCAISCTNLSASAADLILASAAAPMPCVARHVAMSAGVGTTVRIARNASSVTPPKSEPVARTSRTERGSAFGCAPSTIAILLAVLAGRHDARPVSPTAAAPRMAPARCRRFSSRALAASSRAATSMSRISRDESVGPRRSSPAATFASTPGPSTAAAARDRSARSRLPVVATTVPGGGFEPATTERGAGAGRRLDDSASLADVGESESEEW
mmetsp:Transcript_7553/g.30615  ORF Transcript_7553/g.30615 Transcript_7553/m.30615 type:complete len:268 (-) Transcript_7553:974-1777(-)